MAECFTSGEWIAHEGEVDAFIDAWDAFASWSGSRPGAGRLHLVQDLGNPRRFLSFSSWSDLDSIHVWKADPEFRSRMDAVQQHVAEFHSSEMELVRVVGGQPS